MTRTQKERVRSKQQFKKFKWLVVRQIMNTIELYRNIVLMNLK